MPNGYPDDISVLSVYKETMSAISLKLPDELLQVSSECAAELNVSRAEYIRLAIEHFNRENRQRVSARRMAEASPRVRAESMRVNAEFAAFEVDPDA